MNAPALLLAAALTLCLYNWLELRRLRRLLGRALMANFREWASRASPEERRAFLAELDRHP